MKKINLFIISLLTLSLVFLTSCFLDSSEESQNTDNVDSNVRFLLDGRYHLEGTIKLGRYKDYRDENNEWVTNDIEWFVLAEDTENNKILVISKQIIDGKPYDSSGEAVAWNDSELRTWLNTEFLENAFKESEQSIIAESEILNDSGEVVCVDKVFLITSELFGQYLSPYSEYPKEAQATEYAYEQGLLCGSGKHRPKTGGTIRFSNGDKYSSSFSYAYWWYLDTEETKRIHYISSSGNPVTSSYDNVDDIYGVRPAMWLDLSNG